MAAPPIDPRIRNEQVLARDLTTGQQAMMAIGGAIGTGLFLGSGLAVNVAGTGVVWSYAIGALVSLLLGAALTEMCVAHPAAGAFGVYAEMYVSPFATRQTLPTRVPLARLASAVRAVAVLTVLMSTWWVPDLRITLVAGVPWLGLLGIGYLVGSRRPRGPSLEE